MVNQILPANPAPFVVNHFLTPGWVQQACFMRWCKCVAGEDDLPDGKRARMGDAPVLATLQGLFSNGRNPMHGLKASERPSDLPTLRVCMRPVWNLNGVQQRLTLITEINLSLQSMR